MTDPNYTHIAVVLDRSGSMQSIRSDMEGALNKFFKDQAEVEGKCMVDLYTFDDVYETEFTNLPVGYAKATIEPRGMTALLDAMGKTIVGLGTKFRTMQEKNRPGKVLVVVVSDGLENASREHTNDSVKKLIKQQEEKYNWNFVFMGTKFDAVAVGRDYGFKGGSTIEFDPTGETIAVASAALSNYTTTYRGGGSAEFTDEDRENAKSK